MDISGFELQGVWGTGAVHRRQTLDSRQCRVRPALPPPAQITRTLSGARSEINVTPLVDVVLVLLIIFMVITPLLQQGYDVTIPRSAPDPNPAPRPEQIVVSFASNKEIFLNRQRIDPHALAARLSALLESRPDKTVFLSAEDEANYGETLAILDIIRTAGGRIGIVPGGALPVR